MSMKKIIRIICMLVAVCMVGIFSYAKGWTEIDGEWYFLDSDGAKETEVIKSSGGMKYYLDENGVMVRDYLLEGYNDAIYYFNDEGCMVANTWVAVDPQQVLSPLEDGPTVYLYYFGANGRAYKAIDGVKRKTIDGKKYLFDEEGRMLSGWINEQGEMFSSQDVNEDPFQNEYIYYAGDETDGVLREGWYEYTDGSLSEDYYDKESMWFYFNPSSNKKVRCDGDNANVGRDRNYMTKKVNGHTYAFDENGVMLVGWEAEPATKYYAENKVVEGQLVKKEWIFTIPPKDIPHNNDYDDEVERWFYASKSGNITKSVVKQINGKYYVFDSNGIMKSGLVIVDRSSRKYVATVCIESTDGREFMVDRKYIDDDTEFEGIYNKETQILYYFNDDEGDVDYGERIIGEAKLAFSDKDYTFKSEKNGELEGFKSKDKKYYQHGLLLLPDPLIGLGVVLEGYASPSNISAGDLVQGQRNYTQYRPAVYDSADAKIRDVVPDIYENGIRNEYYVSSNLEDYNNGGDYWTPYFKVVDSSGKRVKKSNTVRKDKNDNYWIIGNNGNFIKVVSVPVKYSKSDGWLFRSEFPSSSDKSKSKYMPFGQQDIYNRTVVMTNQLVAGSTAGYDVELDEQYALNFRWIPES